MQIRNSTMRWGAVTQLLHWAIVALIATQFVLALRADPLPLGLQKLALLTQHKNFGMTILMLAVLRILWRLNNPTPAMPERMALWQSRLARASHFALYVLIVLVPLVGWLMSSARSFSVSYFGLFTFPDLVQRDEQLYAVLRTAHGILAWTLGAVAIVHALGALKHHFIDRDNVLRRMLPLRLKGSKP